MMRRQDRFSWVALAIFIFSIFSGSAAKSEEISNQSSAELRSRLIEQCRAYAEKLDPPASSESVLAGCDELWVAFDGDTVVVMPFENAHLLLSCSRSFRNGSGRTYHVGRLPYENLGDKRPRKLLDYQLLQNWVTGAGALLTAPHEGLAFCYFEIERLLDVDWTRLDKKTFFVGVHLTRPNRLEVKNFDYGIFPKGLSILHSHLGGSVQASLVNFASSLEFRANTIEGWIRGANSKIRGNLVIEQNDISGVIDLDNLSIDGDVVIRNNKFLEPVLEAVANSDGSRASQFRMQGAKIAGSFNVSSNQFERQGGSNWQDFYLTKLTFDKSDLTIENNDFVGFVVLEDLEGHKLLLIDNDFQTISIRNNDLHRLRSFNNRYSSYLVAMNNHIRSSFGIEEDRFAKDAGIEIRGNRVAGDVTIAPQSLPDTEAYLHYNHFNGPVEIYIPLFESGSDAALERRAVSCTKVYPNGPSAIPKRPPEYRWSGILNLTGTEVPTKLEISEACRDARLMRPIAVGRSEILDIIKQRHANGGRYCFDENGAGAMHGRIVLSEAKVGVLKFDLPFGDCEYLWTGQGLEFALFGDPNLTAPKDISEDGAALAPLTPEESLDYLFAWRYALMSKEPSTLFTFASYLRGRGHLLHSRDVLTEAKEVVYSYKEPSQDEINQESVYGTFWRWAEWLKARIRVIALSPAGYGANPEQALAVLVGFILILWALLRIYYHGLHYRILAMFSARQDEGSSVGKQKPGPPGLEDPQPQGGFGHQRRSFRNRYQEWAEQKQQKASSPADLLKNGVTKVQGFVAIDRENYSRDFSLLTYAADTCIPVIGLGRYGRYSATSRMMRIIVNLFHIIGWWLVTLFIGALTIL